MIINCIKDFLLLERRTKLLYIEAYLLLAWARILKSLPFGKVAPILGEPMSESTYQYTDSDKKQLGQVTQAIIVMSKYTFWESECLVKAIAAMEMLKKRKLDCTLYLGTRKNEQGQLEAHAWLRSGPFYVTGSEGKERFTVVGKFAKKV